MRADSLNEKISHRPKPEDLIKQGVLHEDPTSPDETYEEKIEEEYAKREGGAWSESQGVNAVGKWNWDLFSSEYLWLGELYEKQNLTLTVNRMILLSQHFKP
jgi:hypothetical protein